LWLLNATSPELDHHLLSKSKVAEDFNNSKSCFVVYLVSLNGNYEVSWLCCGQVGGVGSARSSQQASSTGVKQIVLRLSGLRQSLATSGEPSSGQYGGMISLSSFK